MYKETCSGRYRYRYRERKRKRDVNGKKQLGSSSSSSSLASDLFGSNDSSASSASGIFESIFAPPSKVLGRDCLRAEAVEKKQEPLNSKPDSTSKSNGEQTPIISNEVKTPFYEERGQPCHYSSSIYYGGQDIYSNPRNNQSPAHSTFCKEGEDDSDSASRGNWWQGSLYY